jgi:hypothetical protein
MPGSVSRPETGCQPADSDPEPASIGYRGRPHPEGTLGCGVGERPARGEAGLSLTALPRRGLGWSEEEQRTMAPPHRGPGV